jgi:gas vesicle protein
MKKEYVDALLSGLELGALIGAFVLLLLAFSGKL